MDFQELYNITYQEYIKEAETYLNSLLNKVTILKNAGKLFANDNKLFIRIMNSTDDYVEIYRYIQKIYDILGSKEKGLDYMKLKNIEFIAESIVLSLPTE